MCRTSIRINYPTIKYALNAPFDTSFIRFIIKYPYFSAKRSLADCYGLPFSYIKSYSIINVDILCKDNKIQGECIIKLLQVGGKNDWLYRF